MWELQPAYIIFAFLSLTSTCYVPLCTLFDMLQLLNYLYIYNLFPREQKNA